jgi:glycerol-3-phosphate acyltransferase PlsY
MDIWKVLLCASIGYFAGSISFARLVVRLVAPGQEITGMDLGGAEAEETIRVEAVSGTAVSLKLGAKWGGITALLDILKVALPTLALRFAFPESPYHLLTATTGLIGHNWPIYYRFRGGRGLSPIYGGFLAVDWLGTLVTSTVGMLVGLALLKNVLISYMAGLWLMIPWLWFRTHDAAHVAYIVSVNVIFALAMIPDIAGMIDRKRRGIEMDFAQAMELTPMGRGIGKMANRLGLMRSGRRPDDDSSASQAR